MDNLSAWHVMEYMWPFQDWIDTKNANNQDITTQLSRIAWRVQAIIHRGTESSSRIGNGRI